MVKLLRLIKGCYFKIKSRIFVILWISIVSYLCYDTFMYYKYARKFHYLRVILGLSLCISRATATVLNLCSALILVPMCKKLNLVLYWILSKVCPGLFFMWLEKSKSFHITVATTLFIFAVIHSISHFMNLWNFSRSYNEEIKEINYASYKNESIVLLLLSRAALTGLAMLVILLGMGATAARPVRRRRYNIFWYTHQLYLPLMLLLLLHPLSGVLKEEVLEENEASHSISNLEAPFNSTVKYPKFVPMKSTTWMWLMFPLSCYFVDFLWRMCLRNRARANLLGTSSMPGRTISLALSCPSESFNCQAGQYVLLQCADISLLEWHPFTVVKVPTSSQRYFVVWIRVKGDWTEALEKFILENSCNLSLLVDGPFSSPTQAVMKSSIAICVAAGVGITPFVSVLQDMLRFPRNRFPGRIHLIWIVRYEHEITWLAELANNTILHLRDANRPDRLQIEFYVSNSNRDVRNKYVKYDNGVSYMAVLGKGGNIFSKLDDSNGTSKSKVDEESVNEGIKRSLDNKYNLAKEYPILGCRIKRGRPHWDRVFGNWMQLYPEEHLKLFCCGPKTLVKILKQKCKEVSRTAKTKFTFIHEGFT